MQVDLNLMGYESIEIDFLDKRSRYMFHESVLKIRERLIKQGFNETLGVRFSEKVDSDIIRLDLNQYFKVCGYLILNGIEPLRCRIKIFS